MEKCNLLPYVSKIDKNYHLSGGYNEDFLKREPYNPVLNSCNITLRILTDQAKDFRVICSSSVRFLWENASENSSAALNERKKFHLIHFKIELEAFPLNSSPHREQDEGETLLTS